MKRAPGLLGLCLALAVLAGCAANAGSGRTPRGEWRHQAAACTSSEQCSGGTCVIPDGAVRGSCAPISDGLGSEPLPPDHPRPARGPNGNGTPDEQVVKPQPGDIKL